jgi:hypothetical protein
MAKQRSIRSAAVTRPTASSLAARSLLQIPFPLTPQEPKKTTSAGLLSLPDLTAEENAKLFDLIKALGPPSAPGVRKNSQHRFTKSSVH